MKKFFGLFLILSLVLVASCGGKIKGNITSDGKHIYHVPGDPSYDRTKAEVWFGTEEEARKAGFRKARN